MSNPASPEGGGNDTAALAGLAQSAPERVKKAMGAYLLTSTLYRAGKTAWRKVKERLEHTVTVDSRDDLYPDVMAWLYDSIPDARRRSIRATSSTRSSSDSAVEPTGVNDRPAARLHLHYDGSRSQTVTVDGHRIKVEISHDTDPGRSADGAYHYRVEKVTFTARDVSGREAVLSFLRSAAAARVETGPRLYIGNRWGDWVRSGGVPLRDFATVALPDGLADDMVADLSRFFAQEAQYNKLGLPWHRGFLLQGPPGTGKTTIAKALAARFDLDMYFVPLSDIDDDSSLFRQFSNLPARSLLLLEDIDISTAAKERTDQTKGLSMSALLQALDGVVSPHGIVTVMTTNHLEQLDEALVRAGRIDRTFEIGYTTDDQLTALVDRLVGVRRAFAPVDGLDIAPSDIVEVIKAHIGQPPIHAVEAVAAFIDCARASMTSVS